MKISYLVYFCLIFIFIGIYSCEKLAEEETPVCKDCYNFIYKKTNDSLIKKENYKRLCGGDVVLFESNSDVTTDTTIIKCKCE